MFLKRKYISTITFFLFMLLLASCSKKKSVNLSVDFSSKDLWQYKFTMTTNSSIKIKNDTEKMTTDITFDLIGKSDKTANDVLNVETNNVVIKSTGIDSIERRQLKNKIENMKFKISLKDGLYETNNATSSLVDCNKQNLIRKILRLSPVLPEKSCSPGYSWDRNIKIPIETAFGKSTGYLYRSFTFDSLVTSANGQESAYISWKFSYNLSEDSTTALKDIPKNSIGYGAAILSVTEKKLLKTSAILTTSKTKSDDISISWQENVSLVLKEQLQ